MPTIITAHIVSTNRNSAPLHGLGDGASMAPMSPMGMPLASVAGILMPKAGHST